MSHTTERSSRHPRLRIAILAASATLALAACGDSADEPVAEAATDDVEGGSPSAANPVPFGLVSPATAAELVSDPSITVIDVRTPEEFESGHVEGAAMIDFYGDTFADEIAELDPEQTYLVYCRSGNRSGQTAAMLTDLGFEQVYDMDGGVIAWEGIGLPLVR